MRAIQAQFNNTRQGLTVDEAVYVLEEVTIRRNGPASLRYHIYVSAEAFEEGKRPVGVYAVEVEDDNIDKSVAEQPGQGRNERAINFTLTHPQFSGGKAIEVSDPRAASAQGEDA